MFLDVDVAVFAVTDHDPVLKLLRLLAEQRHDWQPSLPVAICAERFVQKLTDAELQVPALVELARKSVEEAANPPVRRGDPAVSVTADELPDLVADLGQQAIVVVEDSISDECFVLAAAAAFGHHHIVRARRRHWLRFAHAGGKGRMHLFTAREREAFAILVRVAALIDSDRRAPAEPSRNHDEYMRIRSVDGVTEVHMWNWREVENYVPTRVWEDHFPDKEEEIERIRTMAPEQRGVLNVKQTVGTTRRGQVKMPSPLIPDHMVLTEGDFAELGSDAVDELRSFLAMIQRIL